MVWALALIKAGIAFGLRPVEWVQAQFITDNQERLILKVRNAKHDNQRSHGEYRHLIVVKPNTIKKEIEIAKWIISEIKNKEMDYEQWKQHLKMVRQANPNPLFGKTSV